MSFTIIVIFAESVGPVELLVIATVRLYLPGVATDTLNQKLFTPPALSITIPVVLLQASSIDVLENNVPALVPFVLAI